HRCEPRRMSLERRAVQRQPPAVDMRLKARQNLRHAALRVRLLGQVDRTEQEGRQFVLLRLHRSRVVLAVLVRPVRLLARRLLVAVIAARLVLLLMPLAVFVLRLVMMARLLWRACNGCSFSGSRRLRDLRRLHRSDMVVVLLGPELVAAPAAIAPAL